MAFIQKFFTGYQGYGNGETRVGELNRLWYDSISNSIRIGDGTSGGKLVSGAAVSEGISPPVNPLSGAMWWNTTDGNLYIYYNDQWVPATTVNIPIATDSTLGGITVGDNLTIDVHGSLNVPTASAGTSGIINPGAGFLVDGSGTLTLNAGPAFYLDETNMFRLRAGTDTQIGGVKSGNGIIIASDGTINLDTEGLSFAFGDFYAFTNLGPSDGACLSSVNADQDVNIVSNGLGSVNIVGEFNIHKTNTDLETSLSARPIFAITSDGFTKINVPELTVGDSGLLINGNGADPFPTTVNGVTLRTVGNDGLSNTIAFDAHGTGVFPSVSLRCTRGTGNIPTAIQSGDTIGRIAAVGFGSTTFSTDPATGRAVTDIRFIATENYTDVRSGSKIEFYTSPTGGTVRTLSATILPTGITATTFTGNLTGNVTGNVTGNADTVTNGVYTTDTGTVTNTMLAGSIDNNKLANSTISGIALGSNLAALTAGTYLTSAGTYTGATARTFAVDATTDATASKVVARDSNGLITAQNYKGNSRDAGTLGAGSTLTINYATDHHVYVNITGAITIAHTNITAGRNVKVVIVNATGGNLAVTTGVSDINTTGNNSSANLNSNRMGVYEFISFGTTTTTLFASVNK